MVRKGEIACYKQFLFSHNVFHNYISSVRQNAVLCGNGLKEGGSKKRDVNMNMRVFQNNTKVHRPSDRELFNPPLHGYSS